MRARKPQRTILRPLAEAELIHALQKTLQSEVFCVQFFALLDVRCAVSYAWMSTLQFGCIVYFDSNICRAMGRMDRNRSGLSCAQRSLSAKSLAFPASKSRPVCPSSQISALAPRREAITGVPAAKLSIATLPNVSYHCEGKTSTRALPISSAVSARDFAPTHSTSLCSAQNA